MASVVGINPEISLQPSLHPTFNPEIHPELRQALKARDLSFKMSERMQINCCTGCFGNSKEWKDREIVYINHNGEIEPFMRLRKKVLHPRKEHEKSYRRMYEYIVTTVRARGDSENNVLQHVQYTCNFDFNSEIISKHPLRLDTVRKINRALKDYDIHSPSSPNYRRE